MFSSKILASTAHFCSRSIELEVSRCDIKALLPWLKFSAFYSIFQADVWSRIGYRVTTAKVKRVNHMRSSQNTIAKEAVISVTV